MVYRFALLGNGHARLSDNHVSHYRTYTLSSHQQARQLAERLNALLVSWRVQP